MGLLASTSSKGRKGHHKQISETRKVRKPLMEKRRRDRINACLTTLSAILVQAGSPSFVCTSNPSPGSKKKVRFEKADILEQTVTHWHNVKENQIKTSEVTKPELELHSDEPENNAENLSTENSFALGYRSCIDIVDSILEDLETDENISSLRNNLKNHLNSKLNTIVNEPQTTRQPQSSKESSEICNELTANELNDSITFFPQVLPNGSLALVAMRKSDTEMDLTCESSYTGCQLQEGSSSLSSDENAEDEMNDKNGIVFQHKIQQNLENVEDYCIEEVWRPWG